MQILSKLSPKVATISTTCTEYVHPWNYSCPKAAVGMCLCAFRESLKIYSTVYLLSLIMRRRIPTLADLKRTFLGLIRSAWFLSTAAYGFPVFGCSLRKIFGSYNLYTVAFVPAFLTSIVAISFERPSRRSLLALYVANVGTESAWKIAESRNLVKSSRNGLVMLFGVCTAILTYYYKKGYHLKLKKESLFEGLKLVVGDIGAEQKLGRLPAQQLPPTPSVSKERKKHSGRSFVVRYGVIAYFVKSYTNLIDKLKKLPVKSKCCPHRHSCVHYCLSGGIKLFGTGVGIQLGLKLVFQLKRILKHPKVLFSRDTIKIGMFLGGFSAIFRSVSCLLRATSDKDHAYYVFPAILAASTTLNYHPDTSIVLYIFWKCLQITFQLGEVNGYWKSVPRFYEFLYCFWTAMLFHAALVEPKNLRLSYWRFLMGLSGGRVATMDRKPLDAFGLETSKQLADILKRTHGKISYDYFW